jgi:hypothetical protein
MKWRQFVIFMRRMRATWWFYTLMQHGSPLIPRRKMPAYQGSLARSWFWRLRTGAELDYLEEEGGRLRGYELKYGTKIPRSPEAWLRTYPGSSDSVISRDTWLDFLLGTSGES